MSMKCEMYPRVLVISHNVFSTTTNMGKTMTMFFKGWESSNLAQLYFHSEIPNSDVCKRYFRVTDFDMVEATLQFKKTGTVLNESDIDLSIASTRVDAGIKSDIYQYGEKKKPHMYFLRNLLWNTNKWDTKQLSNWIDEFNPDVIFYAAGDYSFSMKIALKICKEKKLPLVVYFGDEYYFLETHKYSFVNWINKRIFKKCFQDMISYLYTFIAASEKMQRRYNNEFKKQGYTIMTPTEVSDTSAISKRNDGVKISYIGNLGLDRWKSLIEIGTCLKQIGQVLDVYSGEKSPSIISQLNLENGIQFRGAVPFNEVKGIIKSSAIIIHVESMDNFNKERTKYSMSTKIAESLGSGSCLFAYGPVDVSSIEYLIESDAACVVTKKEDLQVKLQEILDNENLRKKYINNALRLASERHNFETNTQLFCRIIKDACGDWKSRLKNEDLTG